MGETQTIGEGVMVNRLQDDANYFETGRFLKERIIEEMPELRLETFSKETYVPSGMCDISVEYDYTYKLRLCEGDLEEEVLLEVNCEAYTHRREVNVYSSVLLDIVEEALEGSSWKEFVRLQ
jgi:hypothetical protein